MSVESKSAVIIFDGVCVLCSGWVRFLLRHDRAGTFRFAAMQTVTGRALMQDQGLNPDNPASFLLIDETGAWRDTDAIVRVLRHLGAPWSVTATLLRWVPRGLRNAAYQRVARNRYRWFGRHSRCALPPSNMQDRFIG